MRRWAVTWKPDRTVSSGELEQLQQRFGDCIDVTGPLDEEPAEDAHQTPEAPVTKPAQAPRRRSK